MVRGLYANQTSLDTVGHNITNANTDGYSRQQVNLAATNPQTIFGTSGSYQMGTGVDIQSVTRARDTFVDRQMWKESSTLGYGTAKQDVLSKIEGVFREPSDTGVQTVLNKFWTSLQTLATDASNESVRTAVRQRGVELVDSIQQVNQQLEDMVLDINTTLGIKVDRVSQIASEIASLNRQITTIEVGKVDHANDLRDRRDVLTDELSGLMKINVSEDKDGNYNISSGNLALVMGTDSAKLDTDVDYSSDIFIRYGVSTVKIIDSVTKNEVSFIGGEISGMLASRDSDEFGIKAYFDKLDTMSEFLLKDFNDVHRAGYGLQDSTGINFFGDQAINYSGPPVWKPAAQSGSWIAQVKVNPELFAVADGLQKIAAKTMPGSLSVTKSNVDSGDLTVSGSYNGPGGQTYIVRVETVTGGKVETAKYSTDNGVTWQDAAANNKTDPTSFTLSNGVVVRIATDTDNAAANTFSFRPVQGNASGDNALLLGNRLKTDQRPLLGNASLDTYYNALTGGLGVQVQNANRLVDNQQTLVDQIGAWRESTAGVNLDEEMSDMIRFQKGYAAASRMVSAMDEMLDKLINGTGMVGR